MRVSSYFNHDEKRMELTISGESAADDALLHLLHLKGVSPMFVRSVTQPLMVVIALPIPTGGH